LNLYIAFGDAMGVESVGSVGNQLHHNLELLE